MSDDRSSEERTPDGVGSRVRPAVRPARILHVTTCVGGGVPVAIAQIAERLSGLAHLVAWPAANESMVRGADHAATHLSESPLRAWVQTARAVRAFRPDIVHAHSSVAGVLVRTLPGLRRGRVIYQPHCYKFDDPAMNPLGRKVVYWAERLLAARTAATLALTRHEEDLARALSPRARVVRVVNSPSVGNRRWRGGGSRSVMMVGRLAEQKDPAFYAEVARKVRASDPRVEFRWIGDGEAQWRKLLEGVGVHVLGWLERDRVLEEIAQTGLYLHSASYEGFPLTVLEAAAIGAPVLVRDLPCFEGEGLHSVGTPDAAAAAVLNHFADPVAVEDALQRSRRLREELSQERMVRSYSRAYTILLAESGARSARENLPGEG